MSEMKEIWQDTKDACLGIGCLLGLGIIGCLIWATGSVYSTADSKEEWGAGAMIAIIAIIAAVIGYFTLQSQLENISREQKNQSVQLGVIRENLSKLLERK